MKKYVCILCDERKTADTAHNLCGKTGVCKDCFDKIAKTSPALPYKGTLDIAYIVSPFEYTGSIRQAIWDLKFCNCWAYAGLFADMMRDYLDSYNIWEQFDYIVPVPLHKKRFAERGYNQAELIGRHISEYLNIPMSKDMLERIRATKRQSELPRMDKMLNVQDAFICRYDLSDKKILLFDDICTTGNTLQACASALKAAGAKYICALTFLIHVEDKLPIITY